MDRKRETATQRGAALGLRVVDGDVPRAVFGVWKDKAREDRQDVRRQGVKGQVRTLDRRASGERGKAAPAEHFGTARELALLGVPLENAFGRAVQALSMTYTLAYESVARERSGPKAG